MGRYWLAFSLRHRCPSLFKNNQPHSILLPPFCIEWMAAYRDCLQIILLTCSTEIPRCVRIFPSVPFERTRKAIHNKVIDPVTRDVAYKIAHNILPTNYLLFCRHITTDFFCVFCPQKETATHLFMECPYTSVIWTTVRRWPSAIVGFTFPFSHLTILFNVLPKLTQLRNDLSLNYF